MKTIKFTRSATLATLKAAKVGTSYVFAGHRTSANAPFFRAGFKFSTNMAWIVLFGKKPPVPVTIITVLEVPNVEPLPSRNKKRSAP